MSKILADAPSPERWDYWLRHRAEPERYWVHPGLLDRLANDERLHAADANDVVGPDAAALARREKHSFYVDSSVLSSLVADYRAQRADDGQVVLKVVPPEVPNAVLGGSGEPVVAASLVDLLGSSDAREQHFANTALERARSQLLSTGLAKPQ